MHTYVCQDLFLSASDGPSRIRDRREHWPFLLRARFLGSAVHNGAIFSIYVPLCTPQCTHTNFIQQIRRQCVRITLKYHWFGDKTRKYTNSICWKLCNGRKWVSICRLNARIVQSSLANFATFHRSLRELCWPDAIQTVQIIDDVDGGLYEQLRIAHHINRSHAIVKSDRADV